MEDGPIKLGDRIELCGFGKLDSATMIVLKKMIGNFTRKFEENCKQFEQLKIDFAKLDEKEFKLSASLVDGERTFPAELEGRNLFISVGDILRELEKEVL